MKEGCTALFIRTESADYYVYSFLGVLSEEEALSKAETLCPEERSSWQYWQLHTRTGGMDD